MKKFFSFFMFFCLAFVGSFTYATEQVDPLINFYQRLFDRLDKDENPNLVVSLPCATINMGMVSLAQHKVSLSDLIGVTNEYLSDFFYEIAEQDSLLVANSVWGNEAKGIEFSDDFVHSVRHYYDATIETLVFNDSARKRINSWANLYTKGLIESVYPDRLDPSIDCILMTALTFSSSWENPYSDLDIDTGTFNLEDGNQVEVNYLSSFEDSFTSFNCKCFVKNYVGGYRFIGILPDMSGQFSLDLERVIADSYEREKEEAFIFLPEFSLSSETQLYKPLIDLGFGSIFEELGVANVFQKCKVELDRHGTKAAAVTVTEMAFGSPPEILKFDRPFYGLIMTATGYPLFVLRVGNPTN